MDQDGVMVYYPADAFDPPKQHHDSVACGQRYLTHDNGTKDCEPTVMLLCVHRDGSFCVVREYGGGPLR